MRNKIIHLLKGASPADPGKGAPPPEEPPFIGAVVLVPATAN